jgi:pimeloyl-ACP methyl ester carboxylesterase
LCDGFVWERQIEAFGDDADVVVVSYGSADSLVSMARLALESVTGTVSVVGHPMGARVALEAWALEPERIERLALLDTGVHGVTPGELEARRAIVEVSAEHGMAALDDAWLAPMVHVDRRDDDAFMAPLRAMMRRFTPSLHAAQITALSTRRDQTPVLASVTVPTVIAVGDADEWSPVAQHEAMLEHLPHAKLTVIDHAGHMTTVEQPDAVTGLLRSWLALAPADPRGRTR